MNNLTFFILIIILFIIILTILIIVLTVYKTIISFGKQYSKHANKVLDLCKRINDDRSIIENNTTLLGFISNDLTFIRQNMIRRKNPIKDND